MPGDDPTRLAFFHGHFKPRRFKFRVEVPFGEGKIIERRLKCLVIRMLERRTGQGNARQEFFHGGLLRRRPVNDDGRFRQLNLTPRRHRHFRFLSPVRHRAGRFVIPEGFQGIGRRLHEPSFIGKFPAGRRETGQRDSHIFQSVAFRPPHQNVRSRSRQYRPSQGENE